MQLDQHLAKVDKKDNNEVCRSSVEFFSEPSRSIHPNVSLSRALAPDRSLYSEEERSRVSTASSVGTNHGTVPHPNISQVADLRNQSQQTSWTHPNVQVNRPKQYSRCPNPLPNTNCQNQQTNLSSDQSPESNCDPPNSSSGPLTSGPSSCSQSSQTNPGYNSCAKFSQNRRSKPQSAYCGGRVRPKSSRASRKKSMRQLKFQAPCDSFNVCENCKASTSKLASKSSSCLPRVSQAISVPASSKSSCMSMDICSDCREAHAVRSTDSCQSSDICEDCGASKTLSGYASSGVASCDSEGVCSECAGSHRTEQNSCQSMAVCSECRAAVRSPSRVTSRPSMNSQANMRVRSGTKSITGASCNSASICEDCARKCAASPCTSSAMSICRSCSKPFTPETNSSALHDPTFGSVGRQQQGTFGKPSCQSMNGCNHSKMAVQASCASCGSKLTSPAKPSGCKATSKVNFSHPERECDCQHSDTDLSKLDVINCIHKQLIANFSFPGPKKSTASLVEKPSALSQGTQKSLSASNFTQTDAYDENDDAFECLSADFCDECGGLPDCKDEPSSNDEKQEAQRKSSRRSVAASVEKQRSLRSASSRRSKSPVPCSKRSTGTSLPGPCGKMQNQSTTSAAIKSTNPCQGLNCDENPCASFQRQLSAKCPPKKQVDQPKAESPCPKLREDRQSKLKLQQKSEKRCKILEDVTKSCPEPVANDASGEKKLLYLKARNRDDNEFQCDENPCGAIDKARAQSQEKVLKKRAEMANKEKAKKDMYDALLEPELEPEKEARPEECPGTDNDCKAIERRSKPKKFSKKYQKMRYEIELQNFILDKIHRQLKVKVKKCCPQSELQGLKQSLDREVEKLREMVRFAIDMQRENQDEIWGSIPISTQSKVDFSEMQACDDRSSAMKPPQKPSQTSQLSGFDDLDDIMYGCAKESCQESEKSRDEKCCQPKMKRCEEEVRCEELFPEPTECPKKSAQPCKKSQVKSCADDEVEKELKSVTDSMKSLMSNLASMKCKIKTLRSDFSTLKEGKVKAAQNQKCC